jgi:hypothetical protein
MIPIIDLMHHMDKRNDDVYALEKYVKELNVKLIIKFKTLIKTYDSQHIDP